MTFEEAKKKALQLRPDIDNCTEYDDAFVFGRLDDDNIGGSEPVVIIKETGMAIGMTEYITSKNDLIEIKDWGAF